MTDAPVVVTVYPKQDFWLTLESFPMHHTRRHPNLELSFFAALAHSADGMTVAPVTESAPQIRSYLLIPSFRAHRWAGDRQRHGKVQFSGVSATRRALPGTEM
jgi:hypothetical protein